MEVTIAPLPTGAAVLRLGLREQLEVVLSRRTLEWWEAEADHHLPAAFQRGALPRRLRSWNAADPLPRGRGSDFWRRRIALRVTGARLAGLPWETAFARAVPSSAVVRVSPVRPDVLNVPLTFPPRFLQLEASACVVSSRRLVARLLRRVPREDAAAVAVTGACRLIGGPLPQVPQTEERAGETPG